MLDSGGNNSNETKGFGLNFHFIFGTTVVINSLRKNKGEIDVETIIQFQRFSPFKIVYYTKLKTFWRLEHRAKICFSLLS